MPTIEVRIDDRIRLMSAVLAATDFPEQAQERVGHRPHLHARSTQKRVSAFQQHPAVLGAQHLLNKRAPLDALFTYVLRLSYPDFSIAINPGWVPEQWNLHLRDFYEKAELPALWAEDAAQWEKAQAEASAILKGVDFHHFLKPFVGQVGETLVYMPNISYPSDLAVAVRTGNELICIGPPRIAWGDNPPWPFDEDQGHIYSSSLSQYARLLMYGYLRQHAELVAPVTKKALPVDEAYKKKYPSWGDQFTELVVPGIVTLFLEQAVNKQEANAFIMMERKIKGVTILPGVVSVLRRFLKEQESGKYQRFVDYLPMFPMHLRVAKGITSL